MSEGQLADSFGHSQLKARLRTRCLGLEVEGRAAGALCAIPVPAAIQEHCLHPHSSPEHCPVGMFRWEHSVKVSLASSMHSLCSRGWFVTKSSHVSFHKLLGNCWKYKTVKAIKNHQSGFSLGLLESFLFYFFFQTAGVWEILKQAAAMGVAVCTLCVTERLRG